MREIIEWLLGAPGSIPIGAAMGWRTDWTALYVATDAVIAVVLLMVPAAMGWLGRDRRGLLHEYRPVALVVGAAIAASASIFILDIVAIWYPIWGLLGLAKLATAVLSVAAIGLLWPLLPGFVGLPSSQQLAEVNERLRREAIAHETTLRELEAARSELESRVIERTAELSLVKARFETALHGAKVYVFSQDRDLRYTWIYGPENNARAAEMVGRTDDEVLAAPERDSVIAAKRRVLSTGTAEDCEVSLVMPGPHALYALHIDPIVGPDRSIEGIMCAAIDISRMRSLEGERMRLTDQLGTALQRYETALRGSHVTVFTHDRDLRYTSVSNPMFGREIEDIVGQLDSAILPAESSISIMALKSGVLTAGQAADGELRFADRWYDVHVEPLRDATGGIAGLTGTAVDITSRKASEAHLRDLMRELTHRSKNLLAVIQAMARQTARHTVGIDQFLDQFSARLQALAASHDLLVQESWHGASLLELIHSQLDHYLDREDAPVTIEGPGLLLKPEAAQSLGLAFHELATNAMKYGALSIPAGRVSIRWRDLSADGSGIEIFWREKGGPAVIPPERRGFGSLVIERNLTRALDADVSMAFDPDGLSCRIVIPKNRLVSAR